MCICILQHPDLKNVQNVVGLLGAFFQLNVNDDISNGVNPKMHFRWQVHRKYTPAANPVGYFVHCQNATGLTPSLAVRGTAGQLQLFSFFWQ